MLYYRFGTRRRHEWVRREQLGQAFSCRMRTLVEIISRSSAKLEAAPERNKSLPRKSLKNHYRVYELHQFWTRQAGRARVVSILGLCPHLPSGRRIGRSKLLAAAGSRRAAPAGNWRASEGGRNTRPKVLRMAHPERAPGLSAQGESSVGIPRRARVTRERAKLCAP